MVIVAERRNDIMYTHTVIHTYIHSCGSENGEYVILGWWFGNENGI